MEGVRRGAGGPEEVRKAVRKCERGGKAREVTVRYTSRESKEERIRIPCGYGQIYRVTDIINKTEIGKYIVRREKEC